MSGSKSSFRLLLLPTNISTRKNSNIACYITVLLRKEVIQPHLPIRLPCYDFTPIIGPTFGSALAAQILATSVLYMKLKFAPR